MAREKDEFDVLTFFIIVMFALTLIVGVFAYLLYGQVGKESKKIQSELQALDKIQELAINEKFRNWISREGEGKAGQGPASEFNARIVQSARKEGINIDRLDPKPLIKQRGFQELPFSLTIKACQLEALTRFLFDIEEQWVGSKVKDISLTFVEKEKKWSAELTISIFNTNTAS